MNVSTPESSNLIPLLIYFVGVFGIVGIMYGLAWITGQRHTDHSTNTPYESGIQATGSARIKFTAKFYLIAMLFVIFDLEVVFLFGWAVAARELGWAGYWAMFIFVAIVVAGLIYEWRVGALDWVATNLRAYQRRSIK